MSAFIDACNTRVSELMWMVYANMNAEMLGLPIPYPPAPRPPDCTREDDPCDDWSGPEEDDRYEFDY